MKIYNVLFLLFLLAVTSCDREERILNSPPLPEVPKQTSGYDTKISPEEAIALAEDFANAGVESRSLIKSADRNNVIALRTHNSRSEANDTSIYIINYNDNTGFAAISAKRIESPILAVIDNGNYQETVESDNPGFNLFMEMALQYVDFESEQYMALTDTATLKPGFGLGDDVTPVVNFKYVNDTIAYEVKEPVLGNLTWGQSGAEGNFCPNSIAGCGPVAIAMAISYYEIPSLNYTFPEREVDFELLNWSSLKSHVPERDGWCFSCSSQTHRMIGHLLREIGYRANAEYKTDATSTKLPNIKSTLTNLLPNKTVKGYYDYDSKTVRNALKKGMVLLTGIKGTTDIHGNFNPGSTAHAWIADGFRYKYFIVKKYEKTINEVAWKYVGSETKITDMVHFNWGWNGLGNGYFSGKVFSVIDYEVKDENNRPATYTYSKANYLTIE